MFRFLKRRLSFLICVAVSLLVAFPDSVSASGENSPSSRDLVDMLTDMRPIRVLEAGLAMEGNPKHSPRQWSRVDYLVLLAAWSDAYWKVQPGVVDISILQPALYGSSQLIARVRTYLDEDDKSNSENIKVNGNASSVNASCELARRVKDHAANLVSKICGEMSTMIATHAIVPTWQTITNMVLDGSAVAARLGAFSELDLSQLGSNLRAMRKILERRGNLGSMDKFDMTQHATALVRVNAVLDMLPREHTDSDLP